MVATVAEGDNITVIEGGLTAARGSPKRPEGDGEPPGGHARRKDDPLLECLLLLVRAHGGTLTREAAVAGLPVENGRLSPSLFGRAAQRAGMSSRVARRDLASINQSLLPAVLLLDGEHACILVRYDAAKGRVKVIFPELGEAAITLPAEELAARHTGHVIYVRPRFRFDARTPEVKTVRGRHWFWGVIAENRRIYRDVLVAALMINIFAIAMPLFVMNVYDRVVPNNATDTLWVLAAGVFIVFMGDFILRSMRGHFVDLASSRSDVKLSAYIMERVLGLRMESRPVSTGSFAANLRSFETVRDFISSATVIAFIDVPFAFIFLIVIGWISWPLVLPFLFGISVLLLYTMSVQGRMHELSERTYRAGAQRNAALIEGLAGLETVKTMGAEGPMQRKWEQSVAHLSRVGAQLRLLSASTVNGAMWVQQMVSVTIILVGVYMIGEGLLSMGGLVACYMLSSRAMAPVGQVAGLLVQYHNASTALASLDTLMEKEVERPESSNFISRRSFSGDIEFRDVTFGYPGQEVAALRNVSLRIRAGEHVGILGRVGSGKTTLEKLILGLYRPVSGAVLVDGIDLRQLDPAELRRNIGYVPQDIVLFYGTLRDNIAFGAPLAEDAEVVRAAETAGITGFVNAHPRGFDMTIGERGESLSGGQRQGVAIARAMINDPPILMLDEPTASMDHTSEEEVKQRLREVAKGKTMIIVTHRTSLLELVDRIIVVDEGRIVADGPKAQVVEALRQGRVGRAA